MKQKRLTWKEIKKRYPNQWVSLIQVEKDEEGSVKAGVVVAAGADLKSVTKLLKKQNCLADRSEYTGEIKRFLGFAKWDIEDLDAPPAT